MNYLELSMRWAHIVGAILLAGGLAYQWIVLPRRDADGETLPETWKETTRRRWSMLVGIATALLLISGLVNTALISMRFSFPQNYYHMVLGIKILLALVAFFLAAALAGRRNLAQRLRAQSGKWLAIATLVSLAVVLFGGLLKIAERVPKP